MIINTLGGSFGDEDALVCPRCGGMYLHHCGVTVYDRGEDADFLVRTMVFDGEYGLG
jgi:hypothetical protein